MAKAGLDVSSLTPSYCEVNSLHGYLLLPAAFCHQLVPPYKPWMEPSETMSKNEQFPFLLISSGICQCRKS